MSDWRDLSGANSGYVIELYERYHENPAAVDGATREFFAHWSPPWDGDSSVSCASPPTAKVVAAANLAHAIRAFGHLAAHLDPLGSPPPGDSSLELDFYGLSEGDLNRLPAGVIGGPAAQGAADALEAIERLRRVYMSSTGHDYEHIHAPREREWLRQAAESGSFRPPRQPVDERGVLARLTEVEALEHFMHRTFAGKTRFSLEGLDVLVPMLDEIICSAAAGGIQSVPIAMAHRGRLNILAHVLHKPFAQIFAEFRDPGRGRDSATGVDLGWTGDVKYHAGGRRELDEVDVPQTVVITMLPNPSHLEATDPIAIGMARAAGERVTEPGPPVFDECVSLPILLHGDAAFSGQGIVAETLNMSRLEGYSTGGTLHIIENNQLGYTTEPRAARSTLYASDLAKGFEIPVIHVNADDPVACIEAARLAVAYRMTFNKDLVIDLIGYRRYGHNEGDEPAYTQPLMYDRIGRQPSVRAQYAENLVQRGIVHAQEPQALIREYTRRLASALDALQPERDLNEPVPNLPTPHAAQQAKTAVAAEWISELHNQLLILPAGLTPHPKIERTMERRRHALDDRNAATIDWAMAEQLAFATILAEGVSIRLTGEDVARGTFGQRHAVLHDFRNGRIFSPLQTLPQARAAFAVVDSPLSENAALGFEYGYNAQAPGRLVMWEAQYGDFVNGAQLVIDEYVASARSKWGQTPSLVLLLPHGWEGAGPDHSSARLERFLELAAETNMRIANATTAAQYFHLLRRQAALLATDPLPLIVMMPKSLLRHPSAASSLEELAEGRWQPVIDDPSAQQHCSTVKRLVMCSGKVYYDLKASEQYGQNPSVAMVRVEQLYPFPEAEIRSLIGSYGNLSRLVWLQEEPENMGAWTFVRPLLERLLGLPGALQFVGRSRNASPAEGSLARHTAIQRELVAKAFSDV